MNKNFGIAGAVAGLMLVGTFGAVACDSSDSPKPKAAVVQHTSKPKPKSTPMSERVQTWYTSVGSDLDTIIDDLDTASSAADNQDVDGMTVACSNGQIDTATLAGKAAYPADPELWNTAMKDLDDAFTDCYNGDYEDAATGFSQVGDDFANLTSSVNDYI